MCYVLGVDGGNTKTIALVARSDGTIVGAGRSGCGDIYSATIAELSIPAVEQAVQAALASCGVSPADLAAGVFSMAGADWPEDHDFIERIMRWYGFGRTIAIVNDALGALRAGSADGTGVVVVCGTGAAIGARAADGRVWHGGFWPEPLGAVELSRRTLRAVYRAELGIAPPTALVARVCEFYGQARVEDVLHMHTARGAAMRANDGRLARVLLDVAHAGDSTARRIVAAHGASLGEYALVAAQQVGLVAAPFTLVLAGGVLRHPSQLLSDALIAHVRAGAPAARPAFSRFEPAVGALLLALEATGVVADEPLLAQLERTLPPAALFAT